MYLRERLSSCKKQYKLSSLQLRMDAPRAMLSPVSHSYILIAELTFPDESASILRGAEGRGGKVGNSGIFYA